MKNKTRERKIPRTELEIELTYDKIILQKEVRNLQMHLYAVLAVVDEIFEKKDLRVNQNPR